jgi:hypothetical protein
MNFFFVVKGKAAQVEKRMLFQDVRRSFVRGCLTVVAEL